MAIVKSMPKITNYQQVSHWLKYICQAEKLGEAFLMSAHNCSAHPDLALREMALLHELANRGRRSGFGVDRFVVSFDPRDQLSPQHALKIVEDLMHRAGLHRNRQYLLCVHTDCRHVHVHVTLNHTLTTYRRKEIYWNNEIWKLRNLADALCVENQLSVISRPLFLRSNLPEWQWKKLTFYVRPFDRLRTCLLYHLAKAASMETFLEGVRKDGYAVKLEGGKYYFRHRQNPKSRWIDASRLQEDFTPAGFLQLLEEVPLYYFYLDDMERYHSDKGKAQAVVRSIQYMVMCRKFLNRHNIRSSEELKAAYEQAKRTYLREHSAESRRHWLELEAALQLTSSTPWFSR